MSNKRSARKSAKVLKYVEDSESDDKSPLKKENTSRKNSTDDTDSDDKKAEDLPSTYFFSFPSMKYLSHIMAE